MYFILALTCWVVLLISSRDVLVFYSKVFPLKLLGGGVLLFEIIVGIQYAKETYPFVYDMSMICPLDVLVVNHLPRTCSILNL
jgi:hypothetical protein